MGSKRSYEGPALDATGQHITESPVWGNSGETVDVTPDPDGIETTTNVPVPDAGDDRDDQDDVDDESVTVDRPDVDGQTTFADWGRSA